MQDFPILKGLTFLSRFVDFWRERVARGECFAGVYFFGKVKYHPHFHYQELDYLLNPKNWKEPYVIDAKYKPRYSASGIQKEDARQIAGYSRLSKVYKVLGLDENESPPIKCLIVYPDQNMTDFFDFDRYTEPDFEEFGGYVRLYKVGIKLPTI